MEKKMHWGKHYNKAVLPSYSAQTAYRTVFIL